MNILYCGDANIIDGLYISILSLLKNTNEELHIYVFTMKYENEEKKFKSMSKKTISKLDEIVKEKNTNNFVKLIDITKTVNECIPTANVNTHFTPFCMLRLYADQIEELPSKILYLDNDVVCLKDPYPFYQTDLEKKDLAGVLDYYGSHFFKNLALRKTYLNSGVLLLNLDNIKKHRVFARSRIRCQKIKMMMPDQTAINIYCNHKKIVPRKFNEQKKIHNNTVFRHFTTTFKFWPTIHTQTVKPWNIAELHDILNTYEFDDILDVYQNNIRRIKDE